jgi:hypothetical protein
MKKLINSLRIGLLVLLVISCIAIVDASSLGVHSCGTIYIGEENLDVTDCVAGDTIIWYPSPSLKYDFAPTKLIIINKQSFDVDPAQFYGFTGLWYSLDPSTGKATHVAFMVKESPKSGR